MKRHRFRSRRRGMSLMEVLISLTIVVGLLTAVGTAFHAASDAIEYNDDYFRAAQAARVAMARMTTQLRRADLATVTGANVLAVNTTDPTTGYQTDDTYTYSSTAQTITVQHVYIASSTTTTTYTLPVTFTQCTFAANNTSSGQTITIILKASVGGQTLSLSGSASPRKTLTY